ncbi:hypothetical protein IP90_02287 [Luteimonas cucumeris]|uniref:Transmembrane protein n=1 Tax=Luteimonas cucumeris TaxID=985012 RepID=A0A562L262_9GAMM|nr:DUF6766 family protein [Luteimonas cucumeris]TWI01727.1 hypothetical protein IP90_02287 [Luteimonas cucumeris]
MASRNDTFWRRNGLSLAFIGFMLASLVGQALTGHEVHNQERIEQGGTPITLSQYLVSGHFVSATFENWESEFLQMGMYVLLTVVLRQKGSAESRPMSHAQEKNRIEQGPKPWPVRVGGIARTLYGHSLAIAFGILFLLSFALHLDGSWRRESTMRALQGEDPLPLAVYAVEPQFWFESFQNWQSEFLSVVSLVLLSIWLRQKDSPQSKPVEAPHSQTGT